MRGSETGEFRIVKGGGWNANAFRPRCAARFITDPGSYRSDHVGFRGVREVDDQTRD